MAGMWHDFRHPKTLLSPDGLTRLTERRFVDALGFALAALRTEHEIRTHKYEATRRAQGYHIGMRGTGGATVSFLQSPWHRLRRRPTVLTDYTEFKTGFSVHDTDRWYAPLGIATLTAARDSGTAEISVFLQQDGYGPHARRAFLILAGLARDYGSDRIKVVTDRPQALTRYGFVAADGKPLCRNGSNTMVAPIGRLLG